MKLKESQLWFLWPLSLLYGAVAHLRARLYAKGLLRQKRLDGLVISVGNLTTGGTGKTPMVIWIAQRLLAEEKTAGILTRGYRGGSESENAKPSAAAVSTSTSDEVQLLQARLGDAVALGVGANRFAHGSELARQGVKWFVLDDGFQHLQLARNADVVLIDATNPFGGGQLLPAGRLREPKSALRRADVIVITRSDHAPALEAAIRRDSDAPIFYARSQLDSVRIVRGEYPGAVDADARGRKYFAFCGIGNPSAFVADLRDWGFQVVGQRFFPDHHSFRQHEMDAVAEEAYIAGADSLMCTEKDVFNIADVQWRPFDVRYCRISMRVDRGDEFWDAVMTVAESNVKSKPESNGESKR